MRTQPHIKIFCEGCRAAVKINLSPNGLEEKDIQEAPESKGWLSKDGHDFCPECKCERRKENAIPLSQAVSL